jgi:hypothetical protein
MEFPRQVTHFPQYGQALDKQLVAENEELGCSAATACTAANYNYKRPRYASGLHTASQTLAVFPSLALIAELGFLASCHSFQA